MIENFAVEIISPDKTFMKTDASEVVIPSYEGEIGILRDHIPLITFLRPGLIKIVNNDEKKFFVEEGTVEFANNNLLILSSSLKNLKDLDKKTLESIVSDTKNKLNKENVTDKDRYLLSYKLETLENLN
tara:strand:+ start:11370 stop:11756 length:387 start_codon:yes stop_codon:yes gene_type:complete